MIYVAVYGTLKKGFRNHHFLSNQNSHFLRKDHTGQGYALFVEDLPFLSKREDGKGCEIEIYQIDDQTLESLDYLEGHPDFYRRQVLKMENGFPIWIYVSNVYDFSKVPIEASIDSYQE